MGDCPHELTAATCTICRAAGARRVYVTSGGLAYHYNRDCSALAEGQRQVAARGGEESPIKTIPEPIAAQDRRPCRTCRPRAKGRS